MIEEAQKYLVQEHIDGWLLYDFHGNNNLAHRVLQIPHGMATRRFLYWIPAVGKPVKIVHAVESQMLDHLPGEKRIYASWQSLEKEIQGVLKGQKRVAMEYSKIPYVSKVDGATIDLVRSFGVEVVPSANFILYFTACLDDAQMQSQKRAASSVEEIVEGAWDLIAQRLKKGITERDVQRWIEEQYVARGLITDAPPIVAVNEHSADAHYTPPKEGSSLIREGDIIMIDLWAKEKGERSVYGDITRMAVAGKSSARHQEIFQIVRKAQKAGIALVKERFAAKRAIQGWEVDEIVRSVIRDAGYGEYFVHRTGHSIEVELHGSGTHMDNLEMHDVRPIVPMTCFSVEPGIYLPKEFGVRLESDVLVYRDRVEVTGGEQDSLLELAVQK